MSATELTTLHEYLDGYIANGFIRSFRSPVGTHVIFVLKKDSSFWRSVDYCGLNTIIIKKWYPLSLINVTVDHLQRACIYPMLDRRGPYNHFRIKEVEEWKTACQTRYGVCKYLLMPFGLTNAPTTIQKFINDILREHFDILCVVYLDDILVYINTEEEYTTHVRSILAKLQEAGSFSKTEKCEFHVTSTDFLCYVVSAQSVCKDPSKVKFFLTWNTPTSVKAVRIFLGCAHFYHRFIQDYSRIVSPKPSLVKKDRKFSWTPAADASCFALNDTFTSALVITHFEPTLPSIMETDAFDFLVATVLSQKNKDCILPLVACYSNKMTQAEWNYESYVKELLAIVRSFEDGGSTLNPV